MSDWIFWSLLYGVRPLLGGAIIWLKQDRYLTETQPIAFILFGPATLAMAILCPKHWFASAKERGIEP